MKIKLILCSLTLVILLTDKSLSQTTSSEQPKQSDAQIPMSDKAIVAQLQQEGVKHETARAILWVEKDALTQNEMEEFGKLINQGIINIEKFLDVSFDKNKYQMEKMEYFVSSKIGISHVPRSGKPYVYLTLVRVKNQSAPYLHETTHALLPSLAPPWLGEGFASYVEIIVSERYGGYRSYLFNPDKKGIVELAKEALASETGKKVLPLVGLNALPMRMSKEERELEAAVLQDRKIMAPTFYNLSLSFVSFLVDSVGIKKVVEMVKPLATEDAIRKETGKTTEEWKTAWLNSIAK